MVCLSIVGGQLIITQYSKKTQLFHAAYILLKIKKKKNKIAVFWPPFTHIRLSFYYYYYSISVLTNKHRFVLIEASIRLVLYKLLLVVSFSLDAAICRPNFYENPSQNPAAH